MSAADLQAKLMTALESAPKPVTRAAILRAAADKLPPRELAQFTTWLDVHEAYLLERLNG